METIVVLSPEDTVSFPLFSHCLFLIVTVRKRSCGKVMFLHLSVSHSVHGGGCPSACWDTPLGLTATAADGTHPTGMHACFY